MTIAIHSKLSFTINLNSLSRNELFSARSNLHLNIHTIDTLTVSPSEYRLNNPHCYFTHKNLAEKMWWLISLVAAQFQVALYQNDLATVLLEWKNSTFTITTLINQGVFDNGWIGLGFGSGMRNAPTLYRCFNVSGPKLQIQTPAANQLPVLSSLNGNPVNGTFTPSSMSCTFAVDQAVINKYTDSKLTHVMWSYSLDSGMHQQRNMLQINLNNGDTDTPRHLLFKRLHGFGMIFTWLLLVPSGNIR